MQKATVEVMTSLVVHYALHNLENTLTNHLNRKGVFKVEAVTVHSGYVTETICGSHLPKGKKMEFLFPRPQRL